MRWLLALGLGYTMMVGVAHAECKGAYTGSQLGEDLGAMTTSLRILDETTFMEAGARMEEHLSCVRQVLPPRVYASAYRLVGATHFFRGDREKAQGWFRTAIELAPGFEWDARDLDIDSPLRIAFEAERQAATADPVAIEGKQIKELAGSRLTLDGRELTAAEATLNRPHLLQVVSTGDDTVRQVFVISGNALPEQFLEAAAPVVVASDDAKAGKSGKGGKGGKSGKQGASDSAVAAEADPMAMFNVQTVQRVRPKAKTPLMVSGGVISLAAAGLYGVTFVTHGQFDKATTTDELESARNLTNTLVLASGATLAVGLGVGYVGIMMDGTPGVRIGGRF